MKNEQISSQCDESTGCFFVLKHSFLLMKKQWFATVCFTISEFCVAYFNGIIFIYCERWIIMIFRTDAELYNEIGANIKFYRKKAGLTQQDLADKAQISISYLSKLEATGCKKSISIAMLNNIANALDIELVRFFERRNNL